MTNGYQKTRPGQRTTPKWSSNIPTLTTSSDVCLHELTSASDDHVGVFFSFLPDSMYLAQILCTVFLLQLKCAAITFFKIPLRLSLILWNSMTLTSFVFTELANTMKYGGGVLYNLVFTEWRYWVPQNEVWGRGFYKTLFSPSDVTALHRFRLPMSRLEPIITMHRHNFSWECVKHYVDIMTVIQLKSCIHIMSVQYTTWPLSSAYSGLCMNCGGEQAYYVHCV